MKRAAGKQQRRDHARAFYSTFAAFHEAASAEKAPQSDCSSANKPLTGARMTEAHIDRVVDFINDLFLGLRHGDRFPDGVEIIECADGSLWVTFEPKAGRTPVVELHLRNKLRASITAAMLHEMLEQLWWARSCATVERHDYDPRGREPISKDYLKVLLDCLVDGRKTIRSVEGRLLDAELVLPRQDVESAICFAIPSAAEAAA